jgi:integral membrane sensor domain MASE1
MNNNLLISAKYKVLGWILTAVFGVLGFFCLYNDFSFDFLTFTEKKHGIFESDNNFTNEIALTGTIIGLLIIVFSKQKLEDEYISILRLKSLQISVLISYIIFLILNFSFYGFNFFTASFYNMFTVLIVFIITFHWKLFRLGKEGTKDEE